MNVFIGYGNPLREDDGVGWAIAEEARSVLEAGGVQVLVCHQLTPELALDLIDAAKAVFVDACVEGRPGEIARRSVSAEDAVLGGFSHHVTPALLLASARAIGGTAPETLLITVTGARFGFGETLSAPVAAAVPEAAGAGARFLGLAPHHPPRQGPLEREERHA